MTVGVTDKLVGELVAGSWAEGTFALAVAAAIEHDEQILLIGPLGNDFKQTGSCRLVWFSPGKPSLTRWVEWSVSRPA